MADTTFSSGTVIASAWLNDANAAVYRAQSGTPGTTNRTLLNKLTEFISAKDFGAVGDGVTNDTAAIQAWITYCYNNNIAGFLPKGNYSVTSLTLAMTGNRLNQSLVLYGVGRYGSRITKSSGASALLTINSANIATTLSESNLYIGDIAFYGNAKSSPGIVLNCIAYYNLERLMINSFTTGLAVNSSLLGETKDCYIMSNNNGVICANIGPSGCNQNTFFGGSYSYNSVYAMDIGAGSGIYVENVDMEGNGTTLNTSTGAIYIRNTVDDEFGFSVIKFKNVWFEANFGRTFDVETTSGLLLNIEGSSFISPEAGLSLRVQGCRSLFAYGSIFVGTSSVVTVGSSVDKFSFINCFADALTDTSVTPTYIGSTTGTADLASGKPGSYTGTLTGCTTSPTGSISYVKQGKTVTLNMAVISATSNTTSATVTGMPVEIRPSAQRVLTMWTTDNGTEKVSRCVIETSGVITLGNGASGTFTNSGVKGVSSLTVSYEM